MKSTKLSSPAALLAVVITLGAPSAHAQVYEAVRLQAAAPGQNGGLAGAVVLADTEYPGATERRTVVLPVLDYQWANGWFAGTTNGIGYNFSDRPNLQYGVRLTADFGRKASASPALRGLGDIQARPEAGGFLNLALGEDFSLTSSLRYGSGRESKGLVVDLGAAYSTQIAARWRVGLGAGVSLANADHLQSYFGVTGEQALASGYRSYAPAAGLRSGQLSLTVSYSPTPRMSVTAGVSANTLLGDAADSPLVRRKTSASGLLAAVRAF